MPFALLLGMQAAGMVIDWVGSRQQAALARAGAKVEQAGIEANIEASRLSAEDESLEAMKNLRKNLGTQAALFAARGTSTSAGSSVVIRNESITNFNADERIRRLNLMGKEAGLRAGMTMSQLHQSATEKDIWNSFTKRSLQNFPSTQAGWAQYGQGLKQTGASFGITNAFGGK